MKEIEMKECQKCICSKCRKCGACKSCKEWNWKQTNKCYFELDKKD